MEVLVERVTPEKFLVRNVANGREAYFIIPGATQLEIKDRPRLENYIAWQTEETAKELKGPAPIAPPHSKAFQHDLGKTLMAIAETNRIVRETGHGRYY